ncbi:hypothetical protein [Alistipes sp.]|uniref:hypothetical protein n=1 Tax=Alistipes sp. TaxID=1872444 RepID=UPI003A83C9EC
MFTRCCIGLLLLSLLPVAIAARTTPPRDAVRHGVRPDTILLRAAELTVGLPCDSAYLRRRDSVRCHDSLRLRAEERNRRLYDSIRSKTTRRAVPRMLYRMLFVNPQLDTTTIGRVTDESRRFERYSGRRIGEVSIVREPVFDSGGNWLERTGNKLHVMTRERVLRRDLLFGAGDTIAPELLVRNLQLLRSRAYVSDATLELTPDPHDTTRVTVTLRTRDSWTISADGALHGEGRTMAGLSDANILGTGNRLSVATHFSRNDFGYGGNIVAYDVPNLFGTFYKANLSAGRDFYNSELRIGVSKEFILPTDYEAGMAYDNVKAKYYLVDRDTTDLVKSKRFDLWAGRSRYIPSIRSSVFLTARYGFARFLRRPYVSKRYNPAFHDTDDALLGLGLYREKFYTTNMIYGFGTREYLATGYRAEVTGGYSWREFGEDIYLGLSYKVGGFTRAGYLMGGFALGSFIDAATGEWTQSAVDVDLRWFSPLYVWRRSHIRQFMALNYTQGWNRLEGSDEVLRFTARDGLSMLKEDIMGTNRMVLNTETVFFTPYQPLGFRVALFGFADFGLLGRDANVFRNSFYSTFGFGVRLRNERLVFSTIQLRLGVAVGKGGWGDCRYFQASNGTRLEQYRYLPQRPEIVRFR